MIINSGRAIFEWLELIAFVLNARIQFADGSDETLIFRTFHTFVYF